MKKSKVYSIASYIINLVLLGVIIISNKGVILNKNTITLKNMDETTEVANLNKTIDDLNASKTEYSNYITTSKTNLAKAITSAGVSTNGTDSFETMITNVSKILSTKTNDATATADKILSGNTAYVKGNKITGTIANRGAVTASINAGRSYTIPAGYHNGSGKVTAKGSNSNLKTTVLDYRRIWVSRGSSGSYSIDVSSKISCYKKLTINNFWFDYVNTGSGRILLGNVDWSGNWATAVSNIGSYDPETGTLYVSFDGTYIDQDSMITEQRVIAVYLEE